MSHATEIADARFETELAKSQARVNADHMPPDTLSLEIMRGLIWFLTTMLIVMIVALVISQITK